MDPGKQFVTLVLAAGVVVLLLAIGLGERMGDKVMVQAAGNSGNALNPALIITPLPAASGSAGLYGPDWKSSQTLAAAPDPGFPDPRIPPKPLPTLAPRVATPTPTPKWTPNPNLPVWDQTATPSAEPSVAPSAGPPSEAPSPVASSSPVP